MRDIINLSRHSKIKSCDALPNASVKSIKVTIIFVLNCLKSSISVFNKKISSSRSRFSKYAPCQNAISLDTNVMIRLHKQRENTFHKVGNDGISLSVNKSFRSKFFFGMCCIIACFHVLGSFLFINIMLNNLKISFAFMSSNVTLSIFDDFPFEHKLSI